MIVLHVVPYFAPAWAFGGVCRAVTELARAQTSAGHAPIVLTSNALTRSSQLPAGEEWLDGVRVIRLQNRSAAARARFNLSTPAGFRKTLGAVLHESAVDVVHSHEFRTVENLHLIRLPRRGTAPLVVSPHGTLTYATGRGRAKRAWDALFAGRLLPAFDQIVALSPAEADDVRALWARYHVPLDPAQIAIVPNGVDPAAFADRPARPAARGRWNLGNGPVVLFMGRLAERKGIALLVDAFADVAKAFPRARLLIAGPDEGLESTIRAAAHTLGLSDHVVLAGLLSGEDRLAAFAAADLFALPAVGEGFSVSVLEALVCGVPVALSPQCHFPSVVEHNAGVIVNVTRDDWSTALRGLLSDPTRLSAMGACARDLACRSYAWPRIAAQMDSAYSAAREWRRTHRR